MAQEWSGISRNELAVAEKRRSEWSLFRLWNFAHEPKPFELHPPLDAHVSLTSTSFQASFRCGSTSQIMTKRIGRD